MEIFLDSADINEIREAASWGVLSGVTTNPTLMQKANASFQKSIMEICNLVNGPVSAEVLSEDSENMVREAEKLAKIHKNVVVKIPMGIEGLKAIKKLKGKGIKTNCTLVFSSNQALLAAIAGADFVSPFVGRMDDIGNDGMQVVEEIVEMFYNYDFKTKVIVASVRHPLHVTESAMIGADIATVPFEILKKMAGHSLTDKGKILFKQDAEKAGLKI
ncbi:MAG: fructose-6-phosphate aldolase [Candidatus Diapherotrites archaeon]